MNTPDINRDANSEADTDRRRFLASCGRFAVVTPPALTLLLSTSLNSPAISGSNGGPKGNNGYGNGGGDGSPNGKDDRNR